MCALATLVLAACAGTNKPPVAGPKPRTLLVVVFPNQSFQGPHPEGGAGVIHAVRGKRIAEEHHLSDPAAQVSQAVAARLAARHGLSVQAITEPFVDTAFQRGRTAPARPAPRPRADLTLEFRTVEWGIVAADLFHPSRNSGFQYFGWGKLIDNRDGHVEGESNCQQEAFVSEISDDEIRATKAASLRAAMDEVTKRCTEWYDGTLFLPAGIADAPPALPAPPPAAIQTMPPDGGDDARDAGADGSG